MEQIITENIDLTKNENLVKEKRKKGRPVKYIGENPNKYIKKNKFWNIIYYHPENNTELLTLKFKTVDEVAQKLGIKKSIVYIIKKKGIKKYNFIKITTHYE